MRAIQITGYGGPELIHIAQDAPKPAGPGPGQVLVRVAAAGVNQVDTKIRIGYLKAFLPLQFPAILGNELAGTVEAIGEGVAGLAPGDEIYGATGPVGAYADFVLLKADWTVKKPAGLSMVEAAAVPVAVVTSTVALNAGHVGKGTRILVHAAAGSVGSVAVQMAVARGAEVTALTSPANIGFVRGLGAAQVVDRTSDYAATLGGFDVVIDGFGPSAQEKSWKLLRKDGILVSLVSPPSAEAAAAHGVRAMMIQGLPTREALVEGNALIAAGKVKVSVARTFPVEAAAAAMAESAGGEVRGKLVIVFEN